MKRNWMPRTITLTAIGALFALPVAAEDSVVRSGTAYEPATSTTTTMPSSKWIPSTVSRWMPGMTNVIDPVRGNDFRDNRDSTILRNDVPLDQTTLMSSQTSSHAMTTTGREQHSAVDSQGKVVGTATPLPATAVAEAPADTTGTPVTPATGAVGAPPSTTVDHSSTTAAVTDTDTVTAKNRNGEEPVMSGINSETPAAPDQTLQGLDGSGVNSDKVTSHDGASSAGSSATGASGNSSSSGSMNSQSLNQPETSSTSSMSSPSDNASAAASSSNQAPVVIERQTVIVPVPVPQDNQNQQAQSGQEGATGMSSDDSSNASANAQSDEDKLDQMNSGQASDTRNGKTVPPSERE